MSEYQEQYFQSGIFDCDYDSIAGCICDLYHPESVIDVGCGPGHLSRALAKRGVKVTAIDGYSQPEFEEPSISFTPLDLNSFPAVEAFLQGKRYDLAICLEVAEHLNAEAAEKLVAGLTSITPVVVFSAAVPGQGGHLHINLRPRDEWHQQFIARGFLCADRVRERLRAHPGVAPWYRFNTLDYVHKDSPHPPLPDEVIARLIASESAVASAYYERGDALAAAHGRLNHFPVRCYLSLRRWARKLKSGK